MVAGLQAPIIMMSQNRQGQKDRLRADLDYRVNLKNELLLSEVLRRLEAIETHAPAGRRPSSNLARKTSAMAEGVGFEPTVSLTPRSISSRVP